MTWQELAQQQGLEVAVINKRNLQAKRFDAEYYRPSILALERQLQTKTCTPLSSCVKVSDGNHMEVSRYFTEDKDGIPYFRGGDVNDFFLENADPNRIPTDIYEKGVMKRSHFFPEDVLLSIVGTVGSVSMMTDGIGKATGSCKIAILRSENKRRARYIAAFLLSRYGQAQIERNTRGAVQMGLILDDMDKILVALPSGLLENAIHDIIGSAIIMNRQARAAYGEAEKMILDAIGLNKYDNENDAVSIRSLSDAVTSNRFDAEYWQLKYDVVLKRIAAYKGGVSTVGEQFTLIKNNFKPDAGKIYRYIEIGDVSTSNGEVGYTEHSMDELPANAKIEFGERQLIASKVRPNRGAVAILNDHRGYVGSGAFTVLKENGQVPLEVLMVYLKTEPIRDLLLRYNVGTSYPVIRDDDVLNLPMSLLNEKDTAEIVKNVITAHKNLMEAKALIDRAKRAVEVFVEKDEKAALKVIEDV